MPSKTFVMIFLVDNMHNLLLILITSRDVFCRNVLEDELNVGYNIICIPLRQSSEEKCSHLFTHQSQPLYYPESNESGDARSCGYRCQHGKNRGDPETKPEYASPAKPLAQPSAWNLHSSVAVIKSAKNSAWWEANVILINT